MRLSLGRWFLLWMLLVTVVTLTLSVAVVTLRQRALLLAELESRGREVVHLAATAGGESALRPLALAALPECVSVRVATEGGELLWSFGPPFSDAEAVEPSLLRVRGTSPQGRTADGVQVTMLLSTSAIRAQVLDTGVRLAVTLGSALAAALLAGVLLINRVVEPLRKLADHARELRPELPPEISVPAGGASEVIDLATAFQQMAVRLGDQRRRTFDEMSDGVALVDAAGGLLLSNRAMDQLAPWVAPDLPTRDLEAERVEWQLAAAERVLRCVLTHPEGMEHRILVVRDVTRWRRAEERLREAQKMEAVATLAGGVAHDFNNLLAGILLHARLLERDPEGAGAAATAIRELAEEGEVVVRELLRFARPETAPNATIDLGQLVRDQEAMLRHLLPPGVRFVLETVPTPVPVKASDTELRRVILNLVLNARNAVDDNGGLVLVELRTEAQDAVLEVRDDGPGVPPELRDRVFEPFFSLRREGRGAGIGLAVVYTIVRESGGEIAIDTAAEGGARFSIRLPIQRDHECVT